MRELNMEGAGCSSGQHKTFDLKKETLLINKQTLAQLQRDELIRLHAVKLEEQKQAVANAKMLVDTYEGEEGCEEERRAAKRKLRELLQASLPSMPQLEAAPRSPCYTSDLSPSSLCPWNHQ